MDLFQTPIPSQAPIYTYTDYQNQTAPKGGFVEAYFKAFEYAHGQIYKRITRTFTKELYDGPTAHDMCRLNNEYNKEMLEIVSRELHNYLFEGGTIEAYPYPIISFDIGVKTTTSRYNSDYDEYDEYSYSDAYKVVFDPFGSDWRTENSSPKAGPRTFRYKPFYMENKYDQILSDQRYLERRLGELRYERSTFLTRLLPSARKETDRQLLEVQKEYDALAAQYDFKEVEKQAAQYTKDFKAFATQVFQAWYDNTKDLVSN